MIHIFTSCNINIAHDATRILVRKISAFGSISMTPRRRLRIVVCVYPLAKLVIEFDIEFVSRIVSVSNGALH